MPGDIVPDNMIAPAYKSHGLLINGQRATLLLDHIFIDHIYSNVPRTSRLASGSDQPFSTRRLGVIVPQGEPSVFVSQGYYLVLPKSAPHNAPSGLRGLPFESATPLATTPRGGVRTRAAGIRLLHLKQGNCRPRRKVPPSRFAHHAFNETAARPL
jgi:hypothetical protein